MIPYFLPYTDFDDGRRAFVAAHLIEEILPKEGAGSVLRLKDAHEIDAKESPDEIARLINNAKFLNVFGGPAQKGKTELVDVRA